jgi:iron transport multicopper oxidase
MLGLSQVLLLSVYAGAAYAKTVSYDFDVGYVTVSIPPRNQHQQC